MRLFVATEDGMFPDRPDWRPLAISDIVSSSYQLNSYVVNHPNISSETLRRVGTYRSEALTLALDVVTGLTHDTEFYERLNKIIKEIHDLPQ